MDGNTPRDRKRPVRAVLAAAAVIAVLLIGVWVTGALLTEDARTAELLTGGWFVLLGVAVVALGWRHRRLLIPLVAAWAVGSAAVGGYLAVTSKVDRVVAEDVVTVAGPGSASAPSAPSGGTSAPTGDASDRPAEPTTQGGPVQVSAGAFRSAAHETTGDAQLVRKPDGSLVVVLRDLSTDPGPDLRVYVTRGDGSKVERGVDLGKLKGNKGTQQYAVPAGTDAADIEAVVVWCRAFSVSFGAASLKT